VRLGLEDGSEAPLPADELAWARRRGGNLARGDLVLIESTADKEGRPRLTLRQRPEVEGAAVAMDPHTGQVRAIAGGFSFRQSKFNRATQAKRQPGSAFKPFVYLAALEEGYTPASVVLDAPIAIDQGPGLPLWQPENFSERFYGPSTLRLGLEKSRNVMTVRLAQAIGMERVQNTARRFGIAEGLGINLASSLGSNEVTVLSLTTAYAMLVNGGKKVTPALVERIQDRRGRTILRRDERPCSGCQTVAFDGSPPPAVPDDREQVEDPRHAYQMVLMLEGVVERGTAEAAKVLGRPLAGKTGTTNDAKDAWFVGFSPDLVLGVWLGFDQPKSMGDRQTGASLALPPWIEIMRGALKAEPIIPFRTPPGVNLVRIDAETGQLPGPDTRTVIAEAFLPGTEPFRRDEQPLGETTGYGTGLISPAPSGTFTSPTAPPAPPPPEAGGGIY
jgi:penicillin-binding protein 1A